MRIRTTFDVNRALSDDLIWRKKELSALKFAVEKHRSPSDQKVFIRAAIALLYAHWEGFVKQASNIYVEYVREQRLRYDELTPNFIALATKGILRAASPAERIKPHIQVAKFFVTELKTRSSLPKNCINTESNLSSAILRNIADTLDLDFAPYETKSQLIDEKLVGSRNSIAHGEYLEYDSSDYIDLYHDVLALMETFRTQVDNAVSTGAFRAVPPHGTGATIA